MKVTVLVENNTNNELKCEHGLSLFIEYKDKKILLDAGTTDIFSQNAKALGIDLSEVDMAVLSHGHYDHSGGFDCFFTQNYSAPLYLRKSAIDQYYSGNGGFHEIGIPDKVLKWSERFKLVEGVVKLDEDIYLVPHTTKNLECIGERTNLYKGTAQNPMPDDFSHEQSLVFDTSKGYIVFNSCSHGGVANIINEVKESLGDRTVYCYIGGLHMKGMAEGKEICTFSDAMLKDLCDTIKEAGIQHIYTGHCTGTVGYELLKDMIPEYINDLTTGNVISV